MQFDRDNPGIFNPYEGKGSRIVVNEVAGHNLNNIRFEWQDYYRVFSFDGKRLANVVAYVENQKQHYANKTTVPILERINQDNG